ncbi:MAG TPA: AAC(3) family N-acetyltransferase, partial [Candidatus Brocadiia bacterium]|nr:AAC(3) family N-acetyltransferase [Candidatus Brocadiia bacterium]
APKDGRHSARQGPFDRSHTPSSVGRVSEAIRLWPGACRSFHPIHSASAIGPLASELTSGHESGSDFGPQSPFARLVKRRGLIVLLGVGQFCNSTVHVVEDMLGMPYLAQETALVLGPDGEPVPFTCRNCPSGHRDFYNRQGSKWDTAIQAAGVILHGRIGMARVQVMDAALFARAACEILRATPDLLLCDSPGCLFCSSAKRQLQTLGLRQAATQTAPAPES